MGIKVSTDKSRQVSFALRLTDKNGKSYQFNRKQRRGKGKPDPRNISIPERGYNPFRKRQ